MKIRHHREDGLCTLINEHYKYYCTLQQTVTI